MRFKVLEDTSVPGSGSAVGTRLNGTVAFTTSNSFLLRARKITRLDDPHPGFFKRIKRGELIIGHYVYTKYERSSGGGSASGTYVGPPPPAPTTVVSVEYTADSITSFILNANGGPGVPSVSLPSNPEAMAMLSAVANMDKPKYRFIEDLFEIRESLRLIRNSASILNTNLRAIRNLPKFSGSQKASVMADIWLAYRFGYSPLVRSIIQASEAIYQKSDSLLSNVRYRSSGRGSSSADNTITPVLGSDPPNHWLSYRQLRSESRATVYYKYVNTVTPSFSRKYGLRLKDIPYGLYQVIPYSFMVDRVSNLSKAIDALTNLSDPNIVIEGGSVTTSVEEIREVTLTSADSPNPAFKQSRSGDTVRDRWFTITRNSFNPRAVSSYLPSALRPDFSGLVSDASRTLDLVALLQQTLRSKGRRST